MIHAQKRRNRAKRIVQITEAARPQPEAAPLDRLTVSLRPLFDVAADFRQRKPLRGDDP